MGFDKRLLILDQKLIEVKRRRTREVFLGLFEKIDISKVLVKEKLAESGERCQIARGVIF